MTKEELDKFEQELQNKGYKKYPANNSADYAWYKGFGKSELEEDSINYQIAFSVWDFSKYVDLDKHFEKHPFGVSSYILVSRYIDERTDLEIHHTKDIDEIEKLAESFFKWVEDNVKIIKDGTY